MKDTRPRFTGSTDRTILVDEVRGRWNSFAASLPFGDTGKILTHTKSIFAKKWRSSLVIIALLMLWMMVTTFLKMSTISTNPLSRLTTVERLVEANTWAHRTPHDRSPFPLTIDVVKVGDNIYSSKPPSYPLLMAGEAKLMKAVTGLSFYKHKVDYVRMLTFVNQILPYTLLLWVAFIWMLDFTEDIRTINFMLLALGIGNFAYGYAPTINNHTVSAVCIFIGTYLFYRVVFKEESRWWVAALFGLLVGFGVANEMPAMAFSALFLLGMFYKKPKLALIAGATMLIPGAVSLYIYHMLSGEWKPFVFQGHLYRYEGSFWKNPTGIDAVKPPKLRYFFNSFFGYKGLFSMTPIMVLPFVSIVKIWREKHSLRWIGALVLLGSLAVMAFVILRTHNYGGVCQGMRWFIVFTPILLFMAFPLVESLMKKSWGMALCCTLLILSAPWVIEAMWIEAFIEGTWQRAWVNLFGTP